MQGSPRFPAVTKIHHPGSIKCLNWLSLAAAFFILLAAAPTDVRATVALTISTSHRGEDLSLDTSDGWQFTLNSPVLVTDLGVWDGLSRSGPAGDGLGESHLVTIWDGSGNALAQALVPAGTSTTLVDVFRYVSLSSPVLLAPGTYTIAAYYDGSSQTPDSVAFFADPVVTAAELSYDNGMTWFGNGPPAIYAPDENQGYFGPNFQFQAVPESSVFALLAIGAVAVFGLKLGRGRRS